MSIALRTLIAGAAFTVCVAIVWAIDGGSQILAQAPVVGSGVQVQVGTPARPSLQNVDQQMLACIIRANQAEVALGRVAQQRGQSREVKLFADEMVRDHGAIVSKLQQLKSSLSATAGSRTENRTAIVDLPQVGVSVGSAQTGSESTMDQIRQEIDQRCLASQERELQEQDSRQFDRCYMGMQVGAHMEMADVLAVLKVHATSPELRNAITEGAQTTERHLDQARKIMKTLQPR